jgi:hypothetical protein
VRTWCSPARRRDPRRRGPVLDRITWTPLPYRRVRQAWDITSNAGQSWTRTFAGFYARAPDVTAGIETLALESHDRFLADDALEGRGPASRGELLAALYLESRLLALGLEPLPGASAYRMPVPVTAVHVANGRSTLPGGVRLA